MRMLHTMLRVGNMERSIKFYTEILGMKVLRQHDFPEVRPIEFIELFIGHKGIIAFMEGDKANRGTCQGGIFDSGES